MRRVFVLYISLFIVGLTYSQEKRNDSIYFVLGTLNDYIGRSYIFDSSQVDHYWGGDSAVVIVIDSVLRKMHYVPISDTKNPSIHCYDVAKEINSFYSNGRLKKNIFMNETQKYLYIAGAYFRDGSKNDSLYKIQMSNSLSKWDLCFTTVTELGCDSVSVEHASGIPGSSAVYFRPTKILLKYLNDVEPLKYGYRKFFKEYLVKIMGHKEYENYKKINKWE